MADDDPGAQRGDRDAGRAEQALDLAPALQVRGQVVVVVAEPAEVDDLVAASASAAACAKLPRRRRRRARRSRASVERVHQVVRRIAACCCSRERGLVVDVGLHRLADTV